MLVRDFLQPASEMLVVRPGSRCGEIVAGFASCGASCAVIVDGEMRPLGIVTERDVARRIAFRLDPQAPIEAAMTTPLLTIRRRECLYIAIARMRRHGIRHLPVVDRHDRLAGLLVLDGALAAASRPLLRQVDRLSHEGTLDGLHDVKAAQVELAHDLFAEGLPATEIQQLLTRINNDIYRRVGELSLRAMAAEGWGEPPVPAATIVMGSGGRGESFLFPDQDSGFILGDYDDAEHGRIDAFFIELAERMCRDLNTVGIPYCNGYCMAVNPLWRKTLRQWIAQIGLWINRGTTVTIRLADIFFDFEPVWGAVDLGRQLRHRITHLVRANSGFLRQMYQDNAEQGSSIGLFGGFVVERRSGEYRGQVNLKYTGTLPLVSAVRLLALREGVEETSTLRRIAALATAGVFSTDEADDLRAAASLITELLLRRQLADFRAGRRVAYYIDPKALSKRQRSDLLEALHAVHRLRKRAHLEFAAQLF